MKTILISAPVNTRSGYGAHSRDIALSLINSGLYDIKIIPMPWGSTPQTALDNNNENDRKIIERLVLKYDNVPDIFIQITIPNEFHRRGKLNIGITAGIETDLCRVEWILGANKMDLVIATSEHSKHVFENSFWTAKDKSNESISNEVKFIKPCEVLFEGIDTSIYKKTNSIPESIKSELDSIPEDFCYLFVGHWLQGTIGNDRKDIGMLAKVFCDVFKMKPPKTRPALVLKSSGADFSISDKIELEKKLQHIFSMYEGKRPNVYLLHGDLTDVEMNGLYNHSKIKAFVNFTHGEGFGRPMLEFSATGKPIIAPNWSGQVDYLNPKYTVLLDGKLENVHESATNQWIIPESKWFVVDYAKASQKMYDVYANYKKYLDMCKPQMNITNNNFSLLQMQTKLVDIIEKYSNGYVPQSTIPIQKKFELPKLKRIQ